MFHAVTTRHGASGKPFAWSYSKLKNFETCPKRHYHIDIIKEYKDGGEAMDWGMAVHKTLAQRIKDGTALPPLHTSHERWAKWVEEMPGDIVLVEQQMAVDERHDPCEWFGRKAWFRAVADVIKINGPVAVVVDWKTGKIIEDSAQLALTAAVMFQHYPQLQRIRSCFVWLQDNAKTIATLSREEGRQVWDYLSDRVETMKIAHERTEYPPTPNRYCRFCPVKKCPHNGG